MPRCFWLSFSRLRVEIDKVFAISDILNGSSSRFSINPIALARRGSISRIRPKEIVGWESVSYTHLTLPTKA